MKVLKPIYYDEFLCIANNCEFDCCSNWGISIDKTTFFKYRKVKNEFGIELNKNIRRNRRCYSESDYGMIKMKNGVCPFFNNDGLCKIFINLGEEYLSNTCTKYPRIMNVYNNICEKNLQLSCPEVVRTLINMEKKIEFILEEETIKKPSIVKASGKLYDLIWKGRSFSIEVSQLRELDIWKRLIFIKITSERLQDLIKSSKYELVDEVLNELEKTFTNLEVIKSFDEIGQAPIVKIMFINSIIKARDNEKNMNPKFTELLDEFSKNIYNQEDEVNDKLVTQLESKEKKFKKYLKDKEYILEHYIVVNLFENYFKAILDNDIDKQIVKLILMYAVIKYLLLSKWMSNNEVLNDNDIINVISSVSRSIGHFDIFMDNLYNSIKKEGFDSLAYLAILIK